MCIVKTYIYIYVYAYIHTYIHTYINTRIEPYLCVCCEVLSGPTLAVLVVIKWSKLRVV